MPPADGQSTGGGSGKNRPGSSAARPVADAPPASGTSSAEEPRQSAAVPPRQKAPLPTRQQKSLAEQRRREAKNETPITMTELDMNEKEINESKRLLTCFLSGADGPAPDGAAAGRKRTHDDAASLYVERFQHDPKNRSAAYHYRVPPSEKRKR